MKYLLVESALTDLGSVIVTDRRSSGIAGTIRVFWEIMAAIEFRLAATKHPPGAGFNSAVGVWPAVF
jgi:hypothetical protein